MIMIKFRCRRFRSLLALWVGNDLDERQQFVARRHLVECPPCRDYWNELRATQKVLESSRTSVGDQPSLWPEIQNQFAMPVAAVASTGRFRGWMPAAALAAACVAVWFAASTSPAFAPYGLGGRRVFDGPAASPLSAEAASDLAAEQLRRSGQTKSSSNSVRPPAVPVSDTRIWSF
jgi:hypothetical protein